MNNIVPISPNLAPALLRQRMAAGRTTNSNFSEGIRDAFPVLSIKGKVFRARISGVETPFIDPNTRQPIPFLDVVLVNASKNLSKTYYIKGFSDGDMNPPDCWSLDAIKPDPSVANKVSLVCGTCPMNAFGSRITDNGKPAKACQDARRMAVMMPHQIHDAQPLILMARIPQTSLKNLKAYAQMLERNGFEPSACITRMAFDYAEAYPKMLFNFVGPLDDAQYARVVDIAEGDYVKGMLEAPDFENAVSTPAVQASTVLGGLAPQAAPVLGQTPMSSVQPMQASSPIPAQGAPVGMIELPDGRMFNPATGQFVEKPKPEPIVQEVKSTLIELPDGKLFDTATNQFVERAQPKVEMPQLDPAIVALPGGQFFHTGRKVYVTSQEIGAKDFVAEQPATRTRKSRPKKGEEKVPASSIVPPVQEPEGQAQPAGNAAVNAEPAQSNGAAQEGPKPTVSAASLPLQEMLAKLLPPTNQ